MYSLTSSFLDIAVQEPDEAVTDALKGFSDTMKELKELTKSAGPKRKGAPSADPKAKNKGKKAKKWKAFRSILFVGLCWRWKMINHLEPCKIF